MSIFSRIKEIATIFDGAGREVHVLDGPDGEKRIKKINPFDYIPGDEQWCPNCHEQMILKGDVYECPICYKEIFKFDADEGEGYPTFESTFEDDYGYNSDDVDIPDDDGWY